MTIQKSAASMIRPVAIHSLKREDCVHVGFSTDKDLQR